MMQKHTAVEVSDPSGSRLRAVSQENDLPLPPAEELHKLHEIRPEGFLEKVEQYAKEKGEPLTLENFSVFSREIISSSS